MWKQLRESIIYSSIFNLTDYEILREFEAIQKKLIDLFLM